MKRKKVYKAIDSEREFQEIMKTKEDSHIVEDFPLSSGLVAISKILVDAEASWYKEKSEYPNTMEHLRKIGAVVVQMGETYGMQEREVDNEGSWKDNVSLDKTLLKASERIVDFSKNVKDFSSLLNKKGLSKETVDWLKKKSEEKNQMK